MTERRVLAIVAVLVLSCLNGLIVSKESLRRSGEAMFVELAPVDPRSLMQGDYMRLRYDVAQDVAARVPADQRKGIVVVSVDDEGVARTQMTGARRVPLVWKRKGRDIFIGADAYYFQEGQAEHYARARFAELRVASDGTTLLVGLRDERLQPL